jgi:hypothetical protein
MRRRGSCVRRLDLLSYVMDAAPRGNKPHVLRHRYVVSDQRQPWTGKWSCRAPTTSTSLVCGRVYSYRLSPRPCVLCSWPLMSLLGICLGSHDSVGYLPALHWGGTWWRCASWSSSMDLSCSSSLAARVHHGQTRDCHNLIGILVSLLNCLLSWHIKLFWNWLADLLNLLCGKSTAIIC